MEESSGAWKCGCTCRLWSLSGQDKPAVISNSIDESSIEVYDETKNIFNPISVSDYKAFALEQKDKALSEAKEKGLMKTAQENTKKSIKEIVSIIPDTDDYTIEVTFKE